MPVNPFKSESTAPKAIPANASPSPAAASTTTAATKSPAAGKAATVQTTVAKEVSSTVTPKASTPAEKSKLVTGKTRPSRSAMLTPTDKAQIHIMVPGKEGTWVLRDMSKSLRSSPGSSTAFNSILDQEAMVSDNGTGASMQSVSTRIPLDTNAEASLVVEEEKDSSVSRSAAECIQVHSSSEDEELQDDPASAEKDETNINQAASSLPSGAQIGETSRNSFTLLGSEQPDAGSEGDDSSKSLSTDKGPGHGPGPSEVREAFKVNATQLM